MMDIGIAMASGEWVAGLQGKQRQMTVVKYAVTWVSLASRPIGKKYRTATYATF